MKNQPNSLASARHLFFKLALTLSLALPFPALANSVTLASSPLANSSSTTVQPNMMFMLDDSGSMAWDYMPDDALNFNVGYGFNTNHCNGVYYNPAITYIPPVTSTGTSYPNASFTAAWKDGYNTGAGTVNLNTSFTGGSGTGSSGAKGYTGQAFYYTYSGTQTTPAQMLYHNTSSTFYKECISAVGSTTKVDGTNPVNTVFTRVNLATTPTTTITVTSPGGATITVNGNSKTAVSTVLVNGVEILNGTTSQSSNGSTLAGYIANGINACTTTTTGNCTTTGGTGFSATASGNVVTILGPGSAGGYTPAVTNSSGSMTYSYTSFPAVASTYVSGITVNGTQLLTTTNAPPGTTGTSSASTLASSIATAINATGYTATASGNVVTVTGPSSSSLFTPIITTVPATGGLTVTTAAFPDSTPADLQNFANWYSYYSDRMLMMKTGVGLAFAPIGGNYRVGFMTMNNNVAPDYVDIATFTAAQKSAWYTKLYASVPSNSTPLREALSHIGQLFAHKIGSYTTYTSTITVNGNSSTTVTGITVNGAQLMAGTATPSSSSTAVAASVANQINIPVVSNYGAAQSGNVITITSGLASDVGSYPVESDDGGGMTFTITPFVANTVVSNLNGVTPNDPIQYSCQQNFVILSTDGYWNGSTTYDLDNNPVGNQDGIAPRPMYDGAAVNMVTSQTFQKVTQLTATTSQIQKRTTQLQSYTANLQQQTGTLQWQTRLQQTTAPLEWQTKLQQTVAPLQWQTKLQQTTGALDWQTKLQKTTATLQWQTKLQQTVAPLLWQTTLEKTTASLQWQTKLQQATGALQWTTKQQATTGTLTWQTKQQAALGALQWTTKQQATSGTLTWATKQQAALGALQWTTKQQATSGTLTWATTQQIQTGWLQKNVSGSWTNVGASGTCSGGTTTCRLNGSNSTSSTAVALTQSYLAYGATCTVSGSFTSGTGGTADGSGTVVTCPVNASFGPTTNLTAGQTCTGGGTVQCGTTGTSLAYVTTYPGTCAVSYNGASSTSTVGANGLVVTACSVNASYNSTLTSVGASGTCNGSLANIQCSNAGTAAYTTYASPSCTQSFNGATGTSTADASGNVVTCSVNASFGPTTNLASGQTCTGGGNVQCGTTGTSTAYVTTYPGTCAITYNGASSTSTAGTGGLVVTACPVNASYNSTLTSVGASGTCNGSLANIQCSNAGTAAYTTYASPSCTQSFNGATGTSTADASGNVVTCSVNASFGPTTNLASGQTCTGGGNVQCGTSGTSTAYVTTYPGTCTVTYNGASSTSTAGTGGLVVTACPVNASYNGTLTSVGASGTCNGSLANIQCSNAGTAAYLASPTATCTNTFNGAAGTSTANTSGNVTTCSTSATWSTAAAMGASATCPGNGTTIQCPTGAGTTSYLASPAATCSTTWTAAGATSTSDASGNVVTACPTSGTWSTAAAVGANGTCPGNGTTIQCSSTGTAAYLASPTATCSQTFNGAGASSTANAGGNVTTCSTSATWSTAASVGASATCPGNGTTIQCPTGAGTTSYLTSAAATCSTTWTAAGATSTSDASGNVVTACPTSTTWSTAAAVGANGTCPGNGTTIQCSNTGTAAYLTSPTATCTNTFGGASASSTANASGNVTSCSTSGTWSTAQNVGAGGTCTPSATLQCPSGTGTTSYLASPTATCSITWTSVSAANTPDASGNVVTACPTSTTWSTAAAVGANATCPGNGTTVQCPTGATTITYLTSPTQTCSINWTSASSTSTSNASGAVVTACPTSPNWTTLANVPNGSTCTPTSTSNCQYSWGSWSNAASCNMNFNSGSGTWNITSGTNCQYSAPTWVNSATCTIVAPSPGPNYTVAAAVSNCQTTDTGWVGAASCTNSSSGGQTVYCPNPNPVVTGPTPVASCTNQTPSASNNYVGIACTTNILQNSTAVGSCVQSNSGAPTYINTSCTTTTLSTTNNVASCTPGIGGPPTYITTTCTLGTGGTANTLADVAMYYYQNDLRDPSLSNCTGAPSTTYPSGTDVCANNVFVTPQDNNTQQHLTTYTLGIGTRGAMVYTSPNYMSDTSGDFYSVKTGATANTSASPPVCSWQTSGTVCNWPIPASNSYTNIDDLWHAAVNGHGVYYNATDPSALSQGLTNALSSITARKGAAAAAATSTLNPVAGNNYAYVASYTTVNWTGNLEARSINTITGTIATSATWCAENIPADTCLAPATVVASNSGNSTVYNCVTPNATSSSCASPGVFDPVANTCSLPMAVACNGTMPPTVGASSDTRTIYTSNSSDTALINFDATYATSNPTNFSAAHINTLTQWAGLTTAQQAVAGNPVNLINYLRGQTGYDNRSSNPTANQLYRSRLTVLGDALESQPSYIAAPTFSYADAGYSAFATSNAARPGAVYMGTNDGMVHAFNGSTGAENWAYVPSMVIPNMWKLADFNYGTQHVNYVNGSPIISDFYCTSNCPGGVTPSWRTILVGGLNGGGREYYALDITNPTSPSLLWEFTPAQDANLGYTFGLPIVTKMSNGTWVVVVTSGYDNGQLSGDGVTANSPTGNGQGYLYVLDARAGTIINKISTGVGSATTPSGLAKIAAWNTAASTNQASYIYGGDLLGNVWRFDINAGTAFQMAILKDASGNLQPITTTPTLGLIGGERIVFVGTGEYLQTSDLSNTKVQTLYGISDTSSNTLINPRSYTKPLGSTAAGLMVQQTLTANGTVRTGTSNPVDFNVDRGWYIDFPDTGERENVDSDLIQGTLLVPSIVPSSTVCSPGGYGWLNFFDYTSGAPVAIPLTSGATPNTNVSVQYSAPIVGMNILYITGSPIVEVVTATNPTPTVNNQVAIAPQTSNWTGTRIQWRELIP